MNEWIPVSERLPDGQDGETYLVTIHGRLGTFAEYRNVQKACYSTNLHEFCPEDFPTEDHAGWFGLDEDDYMYREIEDDHTKVTAWMNLIEAYDGDD